MPSLDTCRLSAVVAFAVYDRVAASIDGIPTPAGVLELRAARLRACGLSGAKATYALAPSQAQAGGLIDIENMTARPQAMRRHRADGRPWHSPRFAAGDPADPKSVDVGVRRCHKVVA